MVPLAGMANGTISTQRYILVRIFTHIKISMYKSLMSGNCEKMEIILHRCDKSLQLHMTKQYDYTKNI